MFKEILHSQKTNMFILSRCKVKVKGGQVVYLDSEGLEYNIPYINTVFLGLAEGTSITNEAVKHLTANGVVIMWTLSGGMDMFCGEDLLFQCPTGDYRPTEYMQQWCGFWFDEGKRLQAAKLLQEKRIESLNMHTSKITNLFDVEDRKVGKLLDKYEKSFEKSTNVQQLLGYEGSFVKGLYKQYSLETGKVFKRDTDSNADKVNRFLTLGNYYAYGMARTALWSLGIDNSFPLLHGKTRRGGLVFDLADVIKSSVILGLAFQASEDNLTEREFKQLCIKTFDKLSIMSYLIDTVKYVISEVKDAS
jgi:CRISPR-associated protein Cas1